MRQRTAPAQNPDRRQAPNGNSIILAGLIIALALLPLSSAQSAVMLQFKITKEQLPVSALSESQANLSFLRNGNNNDRLWVSETTLSGSNGQYSAQFRLPFEGQYAVSVYAKADLAGTVYVGTAEFYFTIYEEPNAVTLTSWLSRDIVNPSEVILASAKVMFNNQPMQNVIVKALVGNNATTTLVWDLVYREYRANINSPSQEGCYEVIIYIEESPAIDRADNTHKLYVINTAPTGGVQTSAIPCPLPAGQCKTVEHGRVCVKDHKDKGTPTETQVKLCLDQTLCVAEPPENICCMPNFFGDLDCSSSLDAQDVAFMQQIANMSQQERQSYLTCADVNNDSDVTQDDITCMQNIISGKWRAWHCSDIWCDEYNKGDLNGNNDIDMEDVVLADSIVEMQQAQRLQYVKCADVSGEEGEPDGDVTEDDAECIEAVANGTIEPWDCKELKEEAGRPTITCQSGCPGEIDNKGWETERIEMGLDWELFGRRGKDLEKLKWLTGEHNKIYDDVGPPTEGEKNRALSCMDFNQDGSLTQADVQCWMAMIGGEGTASMSCLNIYGGAKCGTVKGDVNGDGGITCEDVDVLCVITEGRLSGGDSLKQSMKMCLDYNGDSSVTPADCECIYNFMASKAGVPGIEGPCAGCNQSTDAMALYGAAREICGNGMDDDCDGVVDNPEYCSCNEKTPCGMVNDNSGVTILNMGSAINEDSIQFCRKVGQDWKWIDRADWECTADLWGKLGECGIQNRYECNGAAFSCLYFFNTTSVDASEIESKGMWVWSEHNTESTSGIYRSDVENDISGIGYHIKACLEACDDPWGIDVDEECGKDYEDDHCRYKFDCCKEHNCDQYPKITEYYGEKAAKNGSFLSWAGVSPYFSISGKGPEWPLPGVKPKTGG